MITYSILLEKIVFVTTNTAGVDIVYNYITN